MTKVAMTIFVFPPPPGPYSDLGGKPVISCKIPSSSGGRRVLMCHTTGLLATSYIRTLGVPCSQFIDDHHAGQLMVRRDSNLPVWSDLELAEAAAYIVVSVLTSLGYTLLCRSRLSSLPSACVVWVTFVTLFC